MTSRVCWPSNMPMQLASPKPLAADRQRRWTDVPLYHASRPREGVPIGCVLLAAAVLVIFWGFGLRLAFWILLSVIVLVVVLNPWRQHCGRRRGWRIECSGPEAIYYGAWRHGRWEWLEFWAPGGDAVRVGGPEAWRALPSWALDAREEILARLSRELPRYTLVEIE